MKENPFIGMTIGAWAVFLIAGMTTTFKSWAWLIWVPWLGFATIAPLTWAWKHRKK